MESTVIITEGAPVAEGVPEKDNAITKKTTETESRPSLATGYACTVPGGPFPAKFGC